MFNLINHKRKKRDTKSGDAKAAPVAPAPDSAPQSSPVDKPETCTANINGQQQTLNPGDRYCQDDTTHRVCNYGEWIDGQCPEGSKCMKGTNVWQVLCRIVKRNPPQPDHPQDSDAQVQVQSSDNKKPQKRDAPVAPAADSAPVDSAPVDSAPQNSPSGDTCTANINGQQQTLNSGDRYCQDEKTHRVCAYGQWYDGQCPEGSKCLKGSGWQVLCRIVKRNPPQNAPPGESRK